MILERDVVCSFRTTKALAIDTSPDEVEYSTDGMLLGTTRDGTLRLYSPMSGDIQNIIHISNIEKFAFIYPNSIIHSGGNTAYLLSTFDNRYVRTFNDHERQIKAISVCPVEDTVLSSSEECIDYWDVRIKKPIYKINVMNSVGCMSSSNEYAIVVGSSLLKIYDKRSAKGPRTTMKLPEEKYKEVFYSSDAAHLVVSGSRSHLLVDHDGRIKDRVNFEKNNSGCITPDSMSFLYCERGFVFVYDLKARKKLHTFETASLHDNKVRFNPRFLQFVTVSNSLNFWAVENES